METRVLGSSVLAAMPRVVRWEYRVQAWIHDATTWHMCRADFNPGETSTVCEYGNISAQ